MNVHSNPLDTFKEEARELLETLEDNLILLEDDPENQELIDSSFRCLHTIKGSGNMFDLLHLVDFTHKVETIFVKIRDKKLKATKELISLVLQAKDHIQTLLEAEKPDEALFSRGTELLASLQRFNPDAAGSEQKPKNEEPVSSTAAKGTVNTYRIIFQPGEQTFRNGINPLLIIKELSELGHAIVIGYKNYIPHLKEIDPETCYLRWDILLTTDRDLNAVRDVFIFVEDSATVEVNLIDENTVIDADISYKRLGDILVERGDISRETLKSIVTSKDLIGEILVKRGLVSRDTLQAALREQQYVRTIRETRQTADTTASIRVKVEKLDELVNIVGEFVSMHARLVQLAERKGDPDFISFGEQMENLIREVRDLSMELHMIPVENLFTGFKRLVHDLAEELGKDVMLKLEGTETELDKNVIDKLKDPLMHLIRNSLDHGLETPDMRLKAGKDSRGLLTLSAFQSGAHVIIQVEDDGAGINREKVLKKAVEKNLIAPNVQLSEEELLSLLFQPGFSTADKVTGVSGRGVGMDVVKKNIEGLSGTVKVKSVEGRGTVFTLKIPLTLAIIEGLLAQIGGEFFLVNISYIVECVEFPSKEHASRQKLMDFRGELVPYVDLRSFFSVPGERPDTEHIVVVSTEDGKLGLLVDKIVDKYQTVIKPLGKIYEEVQGISGAFMLGDGTIALMVDIDKLGKLFEAKKLSEYRI